MKENVLRIDFVRDLDTHETYVGIYEKQGKLLYHTLSLSEFLKWISEYNLSFDVDDFDAEVERCFNKGQEDWYDEQQAGFPDYVKVY